MSFSSGTLPFSVQPVTKQQDDNPKTVPGAATAYRGDLGGLRSRGCAPREGRWPFSSLGRGRAAHRRGSGKTTGSKAYGCLWCIHGHGNGLRPDRGRGGRRLRTLPRETLQNSKDPAVTTGVHAHDQVHSRAEPYHSSTNIHSLFARGTRVYRECRGEGGTGI